ncbi:hypothetical protein SAMN05443247_05156 [Bradyrhizobium erythrophlei]|nr:hypothetical protein SAMN05443247_05156 [Bradyrhizobium erythrophlei]
MSLRASEAIHRSLRRMGKGALASCPPLLRENVGTVGTLRSAHLRRLPSLRANGSRECAPDDRLREAIHLAAQRKNGLLRRFAPHNDGEHNFAFSRRDVPESCKSFRPKKTEGAGNAGCLLHPRSRVQNCAKKRTRAYRYSRSIPAFPARWFYGLCRALPATNSSCHRRRPIWFVQARSGRRASADLAPATGARTTRFCRTPQHRSSARC